MARAESANSEGMRIRWCGRTSNPVGDVKRFPVGSTPATFRHLAEGYGIAVFAPAGGCGRICKT
jgi:hypothetical protein